MQLAFNLANKILICPILILIHMAANKNKQYSLSQPMEQTSQQVKRKASVKQQEVRRY